MKIIRNGHYYIQIEDLMHLFRNDLQFPRMMYYDLINKHGVSLNKGAFIEIESELYQQYIDACNLLYDFDDLIEKDDDALLYMSRDITRKYNTERSKIVFKGINNSKTKKLIKEDPLIKLDLAKAKRIKDYYLSQLDLATMYRRSNIQAKDLIGEAILRKSL